MKYIKALKRISEGKWYYGIEINNDGITNLHRQLIPIQNSENIPTEIEHRMNSIIESSLKTCLENRRKLEESHK